MDPWAEVRLRARACRAEAVAAAGGDPSAAAVVRAATAIRDIEVAPFAPGTRFEAGVLAVYERVGLILHVDATLPSGTREVVIAHEIGHHELHDDPVEHVTTIDADAHVGAARIVGYSHRERREVAADAFAAELLCPADWLREEILDRGQRPFEVARALGVPEHVVVKQAIRAVLLPPLEAPAVRSSQGVALDPTQTEAARWAGGPLLVDAGPGTGKTATLVGRIAHLLATGVPASRILVLTFSTRAAGELRQRVTEVARDAAGDLWTGTFHAFGLEVLHGWHDLVGRGPRPRILDRDGALDLLERNLHRLPPMSVHRDLRNPAVGLAPVLRTIARCKDEMIMPDDYAAAVRGASLDGGEAVVAAEEFVAIYETYQRLLADEDALDLGDLVTEAARLLEGHDDVARHYGERFAHVLVDEYQDVNAASVRLLGALCGPGTNLWVVGDARQSIYRFRGAEPGNVDRFATEFGGETLSLKRNYRASNAIVGAFGTFARTMGSSAARWQAQRDEGEAVRVMSAPNVAGECLAIRDRIEELRDDGVALGDQAILARTHGALDRIGRNLEHLGVPLLHIGDLFAREEVRDLLALVSIDAEPGGVGLLRLAALPVYAIPRPDALEVVRWAATQKLSIARTLSRAATIPGVSPKGARALSRLGQAIANVGPEATAWTVMTTWLFETHAPSSLVGPAAGRSPMGDTAVYQLLRLAAEEGGGRQRFLARVRRIAALGGGRDHGVVAAEAERGDAVRMTTIHAAKGAEFSAVHLPMAASQFVPMRRQRDDHPPPPDLARLAMTAEDHDAEERCLWFVALSRARDHLTISHARRYANGRDTRPTPFLARIGDVASSDHPIAETGETAMASRPQHPRSAYPVRDLETYMRCPARYAFEVVDGLADASPPSAHRKFLAAVHLTIQAMQREWTDRPTLPTDDDALAALATAWAKAGPVGHPAEGYYRATAERMATRMAQLIGDGSGDVHHDDDWVVDLGAGLVLIRPHRVIEHPWGAITVQELRTSGQGEPSVTRLALLLAGARGRFPDERVTVETLDMETGDVTEGYVFDEVEALAPYGEAIVAIEGGAFAPRPHPGACPSCPFLFACGA